MKYLVQVTQKNARTVLLYLTLGFVTAFLDNWKAVCFQEVLDRLGAGSLTIFAFARYGIIMMSIYILAYLREYPHTRLDQGLYLDFKLMALHKISRIDYQTYQRLGTGKLTQQIENGAQTGKSILLDFYFHLIRGMIPMIGFSLFFIWRISPRIMLAVAAGYGVVFVVTKVLLKNLYRIKEKILNNQEKMNHYLVRGFMEMAVFRVEKRFGSEIRKARTAGDGIVEGQIQVKMIHEAFFVIFILLVGALQLLIMGYAWKTGETSVGEVVALITLLDNAYTPIAIFNVQYVQYRLDRSAFARFEAFLDSREDERLDTGTEITEIRGEICAENLTFAYEGETRSAEQEAEMLQDSRVIFRSLNLRIAPGEKVAFVGESGSGKSTLVKLIAGLLKYREGRILLDGRELSGLCLNSLYEHLTYISQESPVFDGTVRENLVFDREVSEEKLLEALQKVRLRELYQTMEQGLETVIGERGVLLSGGEKQRLALARLWFEKNGLVILDEATSAMDNLTEEAVMNEILEICADRTLICVAHRLTSIRNFQRILVFRGGKIEGQGTFAELMEQNAYFRELYETGV